MTEISNDDKNINHLKNQMLRMKPNEIISLNQRALITLLFIYSDGGKEFSEAVIAENPGLAQRNRIMHGVVGDYKILELLRYYGYLEGESGRYSKWEKIFLTEKGLEKAKYLHESLMASNYEALIHVG
jgi:hypothetical protein